MATPYIKLTGQEIQSKDSDVKISLASNALTMYAGATGASTAVITANTSSITFGAGHDAATPDNYTLSVANIAAQTVTVTKVAENAMSATTLDVSGTTYGHLNMDITGLGTYSTTRLFGLGEDSAESSELARLGDISQANSDINNNLSAEVSRATSAEAILGNSVSAEASRATSAEQSLVSAEASRAVSAEAILTNSVSAEASRATSAEQSLVSAEASRAVSAEAVLTNSVSAEASRATSAEQSLVSAEASRAVSAETILTNNLSAEASRAVSAEAILTNSVSAEASRATSAEQSLVSAEASRAVSAEAVLTNSVSAEASRATSAEQSLVSAEASRAVSAETILTNNLSAEASRATSAEQSLVSAEASRAVSAELDLTNNLSAEASRAVNNETNILAYVNNYMTGVNEATAFKVAGTLTANEFETASLTASTLNTTGMAIMDNIVAGALTGYSDARLKKDVEDVLDATAKVNALHPVFYNWNDKASLNPEHKEIGFIAQEVEAVLPHVVRTLDDEMKTKTVAYDRIVSLLVAALKEHDVRISALEKN